MKKLWLSRTKVIFLNDEDFDWASKWGWRYNKDGYAACDGKMLHIELMKRWGLYIEGMEIEHINGKRNDNQRDNLRMIEPQPKEINIVTNKGVTFNKKTRRYVVRINMGGKRYYLGSFTSIDEANKTYLEAKERKINNGP
jgi:hypothetical protein